MSVTARLIDCDGKPVLVFHVPESPRHEKPLYLHDAPHRSYLRLGGCDEQCLSFEFQRLLRKADEKPFEAEPAELELTSCFDEGSPHWYRERFHLRNPGYDETESPTEFLDRW